MHSFIFLINDILKVFHLDKKVINNETFFFIHLYIQSTALKGIIL